MSALASRFDGGRDRTLTRRRPGSRLPNVNAWRWRAICRALMLVKRRLRPQLCYRITDA